MSSLHPASRGLNNVAKSSTSNINGANTEAPSPSTTILDTLKKKMSQLKDELEVSRDELERSRQQLEEEKRRRECVSRH
jgi:hypothetical protein